MTAVAGLTSAAASFLSAEMYGHWPWIPETMPLPERLVAEYFAASDPLSRCEAFRNRGLTQRQHRGPESLPITAGATMARLDSAIAGRVAGWRFIFRTLEKRAGGKCVPRANDLSA